MSKNFLDRLIAQLAIIDLFICTSAYVMQYFNERFTWIFAISLILLFWLFVAKIFTVLDSLVQ